MNKKVTKKCDHCGKVWDVPYSTKMESIKCPHCNKQYQLTKKTKRNKEISAYVSAFVIIFLLSIFFNLIVGRDNNGLLIAMFIIIGLVAAGIGRPLGEMAYFSFFGYEYEPVEVRKKK